MLQFVKEWQSLLIGAAGILYAYLHDKGGMEASGIVHMLIAAFLLVAMVLNLRDAQRSKSLRSQILTIKDEHATQIEALRRQISGEMAQHHAIVSGLQQTIADLTTPKPSPSLVVDWAHYYAKADENNWKDVMQYVLRHIDENGRLELTVGTDVLGDPFGKGTKELRLCYILDGKPFVDQYPDGAHVCIPPRK